jgi:hypothetical protein
MQKVLLIAKWLFGLGLIITGITSFGDSIIQAVLSILLGLFITPITLQLFEQAAKITIPRPAKWIIAIGGWIAMAYVVSGINDSKDNEARAGYNQAEKEISLGQIDNAIKTLKDLSPSSSSLKDSISTLVALVDKAQSTEYAYSELETMSDEDFKRLENGVLEKKYFDQPELNKHFIQILHSNKDKRAEYKLIAETKKKEEANKVIEDINIFKNIITASSKESYTAKDENEVKVTLALIEAWAQKVKEHEDSDIPEVKQSAKELKKELIAYQVKQFPLIRKSLAKVMKDKMWEHDVDISWSGNGNSSIRFVAGHFATNKNIKQVQESLNDLLSKARFKRADYLWYKGQDDYTYYSISSKKDSDL